MLGYRDIAPQVWLLEGPTEAAKEWGEQHLSIAAEAERVVVRLRLLERRLAEHISRYDPPVWLRQSYRVPDNDRSDDEEPDDTEPVATYRPLALKQSLDYTTSKERAMSAKPARLLTGPNHWGLEGAIDKCEPEPVPAHVLAKFAKEAKDKPRRARVAIEDGQRIDPEARRAFDETTEPAQPYQKAHRPPRVRGPQGTRIPGAATRPQRKRSFAVQLLASPIKGHAGEPRPPKGKSSWGQYRCEVTEQDLVVFRAEKAALGLS